MINTSSQTYPSYLDDIYDQLPPAHQEKVEALAKFRGEPRTKTLQHVINRVGIRDIPVGFKSFLLPPADFEFTELDLDGTHHATIKLKNGRVLTGYRSAARLQRYYRCLSDRLPRSVTAETYEVYMDAYRRYVGALPRNQLKLVPPPGHGGVLVDAGAYFGFKAMGYADHVGPRGRVILIEIDAENERLARRNIEQNNLQSRVQSFCCGVWHSNGTYNDRWRDRSAHTLAETDEHPYCTNNKIVVTRTLDDIFREANVDEIDWLNLQLNGAEPEALDGLVEYFDRVKVILAAAPFHKDGMPKRAALIKKLQARGCSVTETSTTVTAVTARFKHLLPRRD
jgi:FkbM family methyltransferase